MTNINVFTRLCYSKCCMLFQLFCIFCILFAGYLLDFSLFGYRFSSPLVQTVFRNSSHTFDQKLHQRALQLTKAIFIVLDEFPEKFRQSNGSRSNALISQLLGNLSEINIHLQLNIEGLDRVHNQQETKRQQLDMLAERLQADLYVLQHPQVCSNRRFLRVVDFGCGLGCTIHQMINCLQLAYAVKRTLIIPSSVLPWWNNIFKPISSCKAAEVQQVYHSWTPKDLQNNHDRFLNCPDVFLNGTPEFWPPAVPYHLAEDLQRLHGNPFVWYIGQLASYLVKLNGAAHEELLAYEQNIWSTILPSSEGDSKQKPVVVGVHVRRTDKIGEAKYRDLNEYMKVVDRFYTKLDAYHQLAQRSHDWKHVSPPLWMNNRRVVNVHGKLRRYVYLATDEPAVIKEAHVQYPEYVFLHRNKSKANDKKEAFFDVWMLHMSDYLVCTFSSNIGRLVYELMQTRNSALGDASELAVSVDSVFHFLGEKFHPFEVLVSHNENHTGALEVSTIVTAAGLYYDSHREVHRLNAQGAIMGPAVSAPAYKFQEVMKAAPARFHN